MSNNKKFHRKRCLSETMLNSERPIVYSFMSDSYNNNYESTNSKCKMFSVTVSQSQGFIWNQDLFASQYQQNYKVTYDSMVDTTKDLQTDKFLSRRRMSDNCISFKNESRNGIIVMTQIDEIEIDSDTAENRYLKSLVQQ